MKRSVKFPLLRWIKTLFNQIFHPVGRQFREDLSFHPQDPGSMLWEKKDTMVGTVRSWEQLTYNLSHKCYYVPGRFLTEEQLPIRYIALYQRDEHEIPCIFQVGEVVQTEVLPRGRIPVSMRAATDPEELYYFFTVKEWEMLPHRIEIRDTPWGKPLFTHHFLLDRCKVSWELFALSDSRDYCLLQSLHHLLKHKKGTVSLTGTDRVLTLKRGILTITDTKNTTLERVSLKAFKDAPRDTFLRLKKGLL